MGIRKDKILWFIGLFMLCGLWSKAQYALKIVPVDKDSLFVKRHLQLSNDFSNKVSCEAYIKNLSQTLQLKGYTAASVDSVHYDSTFAVVYLFTGELYQLAYVNVHPDDKKILEQAGWNEKLFVNQPLSVPQLQSFQKSILDYFENNGYPFAKIHFDSMKYVGNKFSADLVVEKGYYYKIDSIRIIGTGKMSTNFLQRYLELSIGGPYQKAKLDNVSKRLRELPYVTETQPWDLTLKSDGAELNLYLQQKKASQVNVLLGLAPSSNTDPNVTGNKMLVTGEANINLRNALGSGETIGLNWQQLQKQSPRLDLVFQQPYILKSAFGIDLGFNMYKKDSSYLNLNFLAGLQYNVSAAQSGKVFFQILRTNLLTVDTAAVRATKTLPDVMDVSTSSLGLDYTLSKTNYRLNPRKGNELNVYLAAGTRTIRKNSNIVEMKDTDFSYASLYDTIKLNTYQLRIKLNAAHYFPIGKLSTIKVAAYGGVVQSPTIYKNELFQIGGYKLLRGFNEESIYASKYATGTVEYRILVGVNSYFFAFSDGGWSANHSSYAHYSNTYISAGLGMAYETQAGIFNISFAAGKQSGIDFNLRQSKIHFGYVNYF